MATLDNDFERQDRLDKLISRASTDARQRLSTYVRRYMSPLLIEELFENGKLNDLMDEKEIDWATIIIADVRGFTPQTLDFERKGRSLRTVAELLEKFFDDALETVFEYKGVMGEFQGDQFMAIFGLPSPKPDDADRALLAAIDIYNNAVRLNRHLRMGRVHHLNFDIGIGISTGGPVWVGDIGSSWRREWTMIGTTINLASRVEELTKVDEFATVPGPNIIFTRPTLDSISQPLKDKLEIMEFPARTLRGLGEIEHHMYKIQNENFDNLPILRRRIDSATLAVVQAIAQSIETVQERDETFRLSLTMQAIGEAIASSLNLDEILESVMDGVDRFLYATTASLLLIEEGTNNLRFKAVRPKINLSALRSVENGLVAGGDSIVGYVAGNGTSLNLPDAQNDSRFFSQADSKTGFQTRSVLCTPIRLDDVIIGVIQVIDNHPNKFSDEDLRILEAIAAFAASAIRNAQQYAAISEAETLAAMSVLTSDMAHQIKNDVGIIKVITERLLDKVNRQEDIDTNVLNDKLAKIRTKADSTLMMTDEIRYPFSELTLERVDIRDVLEKVLNTAVSNANLGDDLQIIRKYNEVPPITIDQARIASVFEKIIENAVYAMRDSEEKNLTVILELGNKRTPYVHISIADTGPGIPSELRSRLFRLTTKKPEEANGSAQKGYGGWGYGLWSSSMFIHSLGGRIVLDQIYAKGTRILIDLPLEPTINLHEK